MHIMRGQDLNSHDEVQYRGHKGTRKNEWGIINDSYTTYVTDIDLQRMNFA